MTDINKNFRVKQGLETPTISVDSTATFTKGLKSTTGLAVGGFDLNSEGRSQVIYNSTLSATALLGNYSAGTEGPVLLRAFGQNRTGGTSTTNPQPTFLAEGARGTGTAPTAPGQGSLIANFAGGGYDGNRWTSDYETTATNNVLTPGAMFFFAGEAWTNALGSGSTTATNVGAGYALQIQPTGIRMDQNSRQRPLQAFWSAGSSNAPPTLNINMGNGGSTTPTLTLADGSTSHTGFGRADLYLTNGTFTLYGAPFNSTGSFTGDISGTTLTVTSEPTRPLSVGQRIYSNSAGAWGSVTIGTTITALGTGTGGTGTYTVSQSQTVASTTLYHGPDNQTYAAGPFLIVASARRSGVNGRRNALKQGDNMAGLLFRAITANNSTSIGSDCGGVFMEALEDFTGSARGTRLYLTTINTATNNSTRRLELTDKNHNYNSESHNFKDSSGSTSIATLTTDSVTFSTAVSISNTATTSTLYNAQVSFDTTNPPVSGGGSLSSYPGATKFASTLSGAGITLETFRTSTGIQRWHFSRAGALIFPANSSFTDNVLGATFSGPPNASLSLGDGNSQSFVELTTSTGIKLWTDWQTASQPTIDIQSGQVTFKDAIPGTTIATFSTNSMAVSVTDGVETLDFNLDPTSGLTLTDANSGAYIQSQKDNTTIYAFDGVDPVVKMMIEDNSAHIGVETGQSGGMLVITRGADLATDVEIKGGSDVSLASFNTQTVSVSVPFTFAAYTSATVATLTGSLGQVVAVSDMDGKLAYWNTTDNEWQYVFDNSAV